MNKGRLDAIITNYIMMYFLCILSGVISASKDVQTGPAAADDLTITDAVIHARQEIFA
jgi:hypothetical protein